MQSSANDLMGSQVEQQKHYLRVAFECDLPLLSSFWHQDTEHLKSLPYLKLFEFWMCAAVVVFLIKRKLLIKGVKALKKAAAASTGFILSQETAGSWLSLRAAKERLIAVSSEDTAGRDQQGMEISNRMEQKLSCIAMIQTYKAAPIGVFQFKLKGWLEPCWSPVWTSKKLKGISVWCSLSFQ